MTGLTAEQSHSAIDPEFANGLLTELRKTGRNSPLPADTPSRETPAQTPFPDTRHHQKNGPIAIWVLVSKDVQVQVLSPAQACENTAHVPDSVVSFLADFADAERRQRVNFRRGDAVVAKANGDSD